MQGCNMSFDKPLDVLIDEHENVEMPSQSNVTSIVAYVEVGEYRLFKNTLVSQMNGNRNFI